MNEKSECHAGGRYFIFEAANKKSECPIWGTPASKESADGRDGSLVDSPRAGGRYFIDRSAIRCLPKANARVKVRLTTWLVDQRRLGNECPEISEQTITDAEQQRDLSVHDRADRLLQYIWRSNCRDR